MGLFDEIGRGLSNLGNAAVGGALGGLVGGGGIGQVIGTMSPIGRQVTSAIPGSMLGGAIMGPVGSVLGGVNGAKDFMGGTFGQPSQPGAPGSGFTSPNINLDDPSNPYFGTPGVGLNANNPPSYPRYRSSVDPKTNQVQDAYSYRSQWLPIAQAQLNSNLRGAADQGARLGSRNAAAASSNLAMRGGLSSGAAERINYQGQRDAADVQQRILNDANTTRLGLQATASERDLGTALGDLGNSNAYNMGLFQTMAQLYGANRTADAQVRAGQQPKNIFGGNSFLIPGLI